jgi:hypothetical protein
VRDPILEGIVVHRSDVPCCHPNLLRVCCRRSQQGRCARAARRGQGEAASIPCALAVAGTSEREWGRGEQAGKDMGAGVMAADDLDHLGTDSRRGCSHRHVVVAARLVRIGGKMHCR